MKNMRRYFWINNGQPPHEGCRRGRGGGRWRLSICVHLPPPCRSWVAKFGRQRAALLSWTHLHHLSGGGRGGGERIALLDGRWTPTQDFWADQLNSDTVTPPAETAVGSTLAEYQEPHLATQHTWWPNSFCSSQISALLRLLNVSNPITNYYSWKR